MKKSNIVAYLKPTCGWSSGVRAILKKYDLPYEERDIINNPNYYREMIEHSGQPLSPCVVVDGQMLADVSGDEVEAWLIAHGYVEASDVPAEAPTNRACEAEGAHIRFGK